MFNCVFTLLQNLVQKVRLPPVLSNPWPAVLRARRERRRCPQPRSLLRLRILPLPLHRPLCSPVTSSPCSTGTLRTCQVRRDPTHAFIWREFSFFSSSSRRRPANTRPAPRTERPRRRRPSSPSAANFHVRAAPAAPAAPARAHHPPRHRDDGIPAAGFLPLGSRVER